MAAEAVVDPTAAVVPADSAEAEALVEDIAEA